jgi:carnitine-CoA ligase
MSAPETFAFADLPGLAGRSFEGAPFELTAAEQEGFERATWIDRAYPDPDPPEFPAEIIEGFHALSLLDALQKSCFRIDTDQAYGYNYGLDRVRFVRPLFIGDSITPHFEVAAVERRGEGFLMRLHCRLTVAGAETPRMTAEWLVLILPRATFELVS